MDRTMTDDPDLYRLEESENLTAFDLACVIEFYQRAQQVLYTVELMARRKRTPGREQIAAKAIDSLSSFDATRLKHAANAGLNACELFSDVCNRCDQLVEGWK